jgi:hypothetical protein
MGVEIDMSKRWMGLWVHHLAVETLLLKPRVHLVANHLPMIRLK